MVEDGQRRYVWGPGLAYATDPSGNTVLHVYHTDGLGSVRALTDAGGQVTDTYEYDEFGVPGRRQGTSAQPFQYTGQQRDAETGLLYLRARYYDPGTGRFMQRDPFAGRMSRPGTLNRYAYVGNNPINRTDPSGLDYWDFSGTHPIGSPSLPGFPATAPPPIGITGGIQWETETGQIAVYAGVVVTSPGESGSVTYAPGGQTISTGAQSTVQYTGGPVIGPSVNVGQTVVDPQNYYEFGVGTPGFSAGYISVADTGMQGPPAPSVEQVLQQGVDLAAPDQVESPTLPNPDDFPAPAFPSIEEQNPVPDQPLQDLCGQCG